MESRGPDTESDRRTITSPSGETLTLLETVAEPGGDRLLIRLEVAPGTRVPLHSHDRIEETFEIVEGEAEVEVDARVFESGSGRVTVAPGQVHGFRNTSQRPAVISGSGSPAAETEYFLRMVFALSGDGYIPIPGRGMPKRPLVAAVFLHRSGQNVAPRMPRPIYRVLIAALAALGRWRGHERFLFDRYPDYARFIEARRA